MLLGKWICLFTLSVTIVFTAIAAPLHANDDVQVRRLGIPNQVSLEQTIEKPEIVDRFNWSALDQVWTAAGNQDWQLADQRLKRLQQASPNWGAPSDLIEMIADGLWQQNYADAIEDKRWQDVLELSSFNGVTCPGSLQFWAISEALAETEQNDALLDFLERSLDDCTAVEDQKIVIERGMKHLSLGKLQSLGEMHSRSLAPSNRALLEDYLKKLKRARASEQRNWTMLATLARAHGARDATVQAAWGLLETDPKSALLEFQYALSIESDPEVEYGAALSAYRLGDHRPALALSRDVSSNSFRSERRELSAYAHLQEANILLQSGMYDDAEDQIQNARALSPKIRQNATNLVAALNLARADKAYQSADYQTAIEYARDAASNKSTRDAAGARIAWSLYQSGQNQSAYEAFSALYQSTISADAANGLVLTARRSGSLDRLQPLAITQPGPLLNRLKSEKAGIALQRNDYLIAQRDAPVSLAELVGVDRPYVRQSISFRTNDGAAGEGRVRARSVRTSIGFTTGQTHIEVGAALVEIDAGKGADKARSSKERGAAPFVKLDREGEVSVAAHIAVIPSSIPTDNQIAAAISVERDAGDGIRADVSVFRRNGDESLTSSFGREDEITGETWGRVLETGMEAHLATQVTEKVAVQASVGASVLSGNNIQNNQLVSLGVGATKAFEVEHHAYLSAGPFYQYQAFDQNTNFHSAEHGGYFSPQSYHRAGLGVYGQTEDLKTWMLRYEVSGALEISETNSSPVRPRTDPDGPIFQGSSNIAFAGSARVEFAQKLNEEWTLKVGAAAIASTAFNEAEVGVAFKYVPGGKARVSTRDLGPRSFLRGIV